MRIKYTLVGCVDCIAFVANGTIPEDRPNLADLIRSHLGDDPGSLVNADGCDEKGELRRDDDGNVIDGDHPDFELWREDWFSWSRCECCGSSLGGNRNRLAVLTADAPEMPNRGEIIGCGCCRGPEDDRCCCHIHQDISRGLVAHKCSLHCDAPEVANG